jgi:hypothetical protein
VLPRVYGRDEHGSALILEDVGSPLDKGDGAILLHLARSGSGTLLLDALEMGNASACGKCSAAEQGFR